MFWKLLGKSLDKKLNETKVVLVSGVRFKIKKINPLNYLDGSKALVSAYEIYKTGKDVSPIFSDKKVMEHLSHVICAGVVEPKISLKKEEGSFFIEELFIDHELINGLYEQIMLFTYGKKKVK